MEPLSSFAINIAAGIVLNKLFPSDLGVDKGIKNAFKEATKDWSKNDLIRNRNLNKLLKERDKYLEELFNKNTIPEIEEFTIFIKHFNKRLCDNPSAHRYLKDIKDEKRHLLEIEYLKGLKKGQSEIKNEIIEVKDIVTKIWENQYISSSSTQSTLSSLLRAKKTFEDLILSNKRSISEKKKEIKTFKKNIMTIDESINLLKRDK